MLQFRSADNSTLDTFMPRIAVPAQVDKEATSEGAPSYYYATMVPAAGPAAPGASGTGAAVLAAKAIQGSNSSNLIDGRSSGTSSGAVYSASTNMKLFALVDDNSAAFGDVILGPMLGYGSYGRVYRGESYLSCTQTNYLLLPS